MRELETSIQKVNVGSVVGWINGYVPGKSVFHGRVSNGCRASKLNLESLQRLSLEKGSSSQSEAIASP
jgi:hypothetical protein